MRPVRIRYRLSRRAPYAPHEHDCLLVATRLLVARNFETSLAYGEGHQWPICPSEVHLDPRRNRTSGRFYSIGMYVRRIALCSTTTVVNGNLFTVRSIYLQRLSGAHKARWVRDGSVISGRRSLRWVLRTGVTTGPAGKPLVTARMARNHLLGVSLEVGSRLGLRGRGMKWADWSESVMRLGGNRE